MWWLLAGAASVLEAPSGSPKKLIFVMGMNKRLFEELSCEERFELDAQCDIWQADAIAAQDADMVAEELARQSDALIAEDAERDLMIAEL